MTSGCDQHDEILKLSSRPRDTIRYMTSSNTASCNSRGGRSKHKLYNGQDSPKGVQMMGQ